MAIAYAKRLVREPMYQQMNEILRELLKTGEFAEGDQFLTERQIAERFQVSRPTANKVLGGMVAEGLLEFRKGVGTFVCPPRLNYDIQKLVSFTEKVKQAGKTPATRVLRFERIKASDVEPEVAFKLQVERDRELFSITRLRLADGVPVILEKRWVPISIFPGLSRQELRGSFYALCRQKYKLRIAESDQTIRAVRLLGKDAVTLETRSGSPAFLVSAVGYSGPTATWWEKTLYRGDAYEFHRARSSPGRLIQLLAH
ncbi:MAG: GntR family transcriptional regulator [Terriglobales bacterium]|jgi:GntR family transcriptional regulator